MTLKESLIAIAEAWCAAHGRQLSGLGSMVVRDSKFFARIAAGAGLNVATFERFVGFFRDSTSWPAELIPDDVAAILKALPPHEAEAEQIELALP